MNVSRQSLFRCLTIAWMLQAAIALHMLPQMIERYHNADAEEAKRISMALTNRVSQTGFFRERAKKGYKIKISPQQQNHKISASLLQLKPIPENPRVLKQAESSDPYAPISPVKISEKAFPHSNFSLVDKLVESEIAKKQLVDGERKLILAKNPNGRPELTAHFETMEIKDALNFVEFKMEEMNSLMTECINQGFQKNVQATAVDIKNECVGATYQILFYNYREALSKVKDILLELLKIKLEGLREDYEDETNFFLDMIENLIDKDYSINGSIEIAKKSAKYYVTPQYFEALKDLVAPEINAFDEIHIRLKKSRSDIQALLNQKAKEDADYIAHLQAQINSSSARSLHETSPSKDMVAPSRFLKSVPTEATAIDPNVIDSHLTESGSDISALRSQLAVGGSESNIDAIAPNSALIKTKEDENLI